MSSAGTARRARLSLIVLYVADLEASRRFYEDTVGLTFAREKHGNGPIHYAATIAGGCVLELYPAGPSRPPTRTRLGFMVPGAAGGAWRDPDGNVVVVNAGG
ncbi:VOC family protein [Mycobacterium sp. M1]|uniref:VOC family protein n=1 Tax=Mycolicibacter acidiphilus TaxID=2835306 RepID=A0ABS5RDN2_9MYCO|nr:VOC family protein [Mycolicibacter acidiphilus]MBS9532396.1 VOC family protein [Mycolicibacter acidiphilus]